MRYRILVITAGLVFISSTLILLWSASFEANAGVNYCSSIMNRFYYDRTNQEWSLIKLVSAETQGAYSPCPKDLTIRIGKDRLWGREKGTEGAQNELSPDYNLFPWLVWRGSQEEAKIGWRQERRGAAELRTVEGEEAGCIYSRQSLFRAFCSFLPALPILASLDGVRRSAPNYSCTGTLLWVERAQLNPCSHSQKTRPQVSAERLILATKEAAL